MKSRTVVSEGDVLADRCGELTEDVVEEVIDPPPLQEAERFEAYGVIVTIYPNMTVVIERPAE